LTKEEDLSADIAGMEMSQSLFKTPEDSPLEI